MGKVSPLSPHCLDDRLRKQHPQADHHRNSSKQKRARLQPRGRFEAVTFDQLSETGLNQAGVAPCRQQVQAAEDWKKRERSLQPAKIPTALLYPAGTARSRPILTSLPLQVFIYFGGWWDVLFWLISILVFVYKGELLLCVEGPAKLLMHLSGLVARHAAADQQVVCCCCRADTAIPPAQVCSRVCDTMALPAGGAIEAVLG